MCFRVVVVPVRGADSSHDFRTALNTEGRGTPNAARVRDWSIVRFLPFRQGTEQALKSVPAAHVPPDAALRRPPGDMRLVGDQENQRTV